MEHKICRENLSAYLDGEMPPAEKLLLESHVAACAECREILDELKSLSLSIKKHAVEPVPVSLRNKVFNNSGKKPYFHEWLKPAFTVSLAAAGVLIIFNNLTTKSPEPEQTPLP
ncbi:MAG: zf-HC2 domain-containing protein, partial [bacterium]